jgi:hypothetical protein
MLKAGVGALLLLTADGKYELEGIHVDWCDLIAMVLPVLRVKDLDADYHSICLLMLVPIVHPDRDEAYCTRVVELGGVSIITGGIIKYPFDRKVAEHSVKVLYSLRQVHKLDGDSAKSVILMALHILTNFDDCVPLCLLLCLRVFAGVVCS